MALFLEGHCRLVSVDLTWWLQTTSPSNDDNLCLIIWQNRQEWVIGIAALVVVFSGCPWIGSEDFQRASNTSLPDAICSQPHPHICLKPMSSD